MRLKGLVVRCFLCLPGYSSPFYKKSNMSSYQQEDPNAGIRLTKLPKHDYCPFTVRNSELLPRAYSHVPGISSCADEDGLAQTATQATAWCSTTLHHYSCLAGLTIVTCPRARIFSPESITDTTDRLSFPDLLNPSP